MALARKSAPRSSARSLLMDKWSDGTDKALYRGHLAPKKVYPSYKSKVKHLFFLKLKTKNM